MLEQLKKYWAKVGEHPFLKHLFIIVCVLLVLGVATHLLLLLGTRHSAHRTVPDLTGIPLEEALGEARRQGLEIIVNDSLYVPAYDGGVVLDQLPEKGVGVKPGRKVYVTINSYRQKMVTVPYVAGRSLRQAKNMLEVAGLGDRTDRLSSRSGDQLRARRVRPTASESRRKAAYSSKRAAASPFTSGRAVPFRHSCRRPWGFTSNRPKAVCGSWGSTSARSPSTRESTC